MTKKRRPWLNASILAGALALLAGACFSSDDMDEPASDFDGFSGPVATTAAPSRERQASEPPQPGSADDFGDGGIAVPVVNQVTTVERDIIYRAELVVGVADVGSASAEATRIIESMGGIVFGQQSTGGPQARSVLTFKVLPEDFQAAVAALGSVGEVRTQNISADDVTERVVDLESRIQTAAASVERLRALLENATDIKTVTDLERELLDRETTLETLRGQLRTIQDQVALATIVVTLTEALADPGIALEITAYPGHEDAGLSCPGDPDLEVEEGAAVTLCFEVTNAGDTPLTALAVTDTVLDLDLDDLIAVFGDPNATLEPGQSVELAAEIFVARDLRTRTRVEATPVNDLGEAVTARTVAETRTFFVIAADPGGLPGFSDGLGASWNLLTTIWGLGVVGAGSIIPFLWLFPLAWLVVHWRRRRNRQSADANDRSMSQAAGE
jgi:hypothetical protein